MILYYVLKTAKGFCFAYSAEDQIRENGIKVGEVSLGHKEFPDCQNKKKRLEWIIEGECLVLVRHIIEKD